VVLVLGAGANVGQSPARACAAEGYKVALTARRLKEIDSTAEQLHIPADLSDPKTVVEVFSTVKGEAGDSQPAAATRSDPTNPLSPPLTDFTRDMTVNTTIAFLAAQQAAQSFAELPDSMSKTFIYTGNILHTTITPSLM
ncbi:MAG: hypothetical protein FE78DRAFT_125554, partial [Acidomyces sp. 'richmondensis']